MPTEIYDYMAFEPEKVTSYELGWKGIDVRQPRLAALALFHADYKDMQIPGSVGLPRQRHRQLLRSHQQRRQGAHPGRRIRRQRAA